MGDDFNLVRIIRKARKNAEDEFVKVNLPKASIKLHQAVDQTSDQAEKAENANQGVHRFIRRLACIESVINFVCPRSHLNCADKFTSNDGLLIKTG